MAKIRWSPEALGRVKRIKQYIENESPSAAHEFIKGILEQIENISLFPNIGKSACSQTYPDLQFLIWRHYKIYYEYVEDEDIVEIWGLWDSRSMMQVRKR